MQRLFVHIPKNGGMSIRRGMPDVIVAKAGRHKPPGYTEAAEAHMQRQGEHPGTEHARWRNIADVWQERPTFAIVRNPWARTISRYRFGRQAQRQGKWGKDYPFKSFDEFLAERDRWGNEPFYWHRAARSWYPQVDYVVDEIGKRRCHILRLEHLAEDLMDYAGVTLPETRRNVTKGEEGVTYTDRQRQIVADWYHTDIDFFGFDFDSPATKNTGCCT